MTTYKKITYENNDCAVEYSVKAGQATKLATARTIGISDADASHSGTGASFDGSADVTIKLPATIKASLTGNADTATSAGHATTADSATTAASATSAGTATSASEAAKLATARSIKTDLASEAAASFDGSADVTPGVSGVLPIQNGGTGSATKNFVDMITAQIITSNKTLLGANLQFKSSNIEYNIWPDSYTYGNSQIKGLDKNDHNLYQISSVDSSTQKALFFERNIDTNSSIKLFMVYQGTSYSLLMNKMINGVNTYQTVSSM